MRDFKKCDITFLLRKIDLEMLPHLKIYISLRLMVLCFIESFFTEKIHVIHFLWFERTCSRNASTANNCCNYKFSLINLFSSKVLFWNYYENIYVVFSIAETADSLQDEVTLVPDHPWSNHTIRKVWILTFNSII